MADTDDEQLRDEDELDDDLRDEKIERTLREQRELEELRDRHDLELDSSAAADTARAIHLAEIAEEARDLRLREADAGWHRGRQERARGDHLLEDADSRRDEPGAEATAAAGRAHHRRAADADRQARADDRDAAGYDEVARSRRSEAAEAQGHAPAAGAVQNPPPEAPVARPNRPPVQRKKKAAEVDTSGEPDLSLGGR